MGNSSSKKTLKKLQKLDTSQVSTFPFIDKEIYARVIDVYDGDTITAVFYFAKKPMIMKVRLAGIDTAEMPRRRDGSDRTFEEREMALAAKDFLTEKVDGRCVLVCLRGWGKWAGRVLGDVYLIDKHGKKLQPSMSTYLLGMSLAVPYEGKTKDTDWKKIYDRYFVQLLE